MRVLDERAPVNGIVIQKGVPLPACRGVMRFPFHLMSPGESFEVPVDQIVSLRSAAHYYAKKPA
jgi:hypothetical protein